MYTGQIFDGDTHIQEKDWEFMKDYLPSRYHDRWLITKRHGPEGFGLYIGDRGCGVTMDEWPEDGSMPPPGRLKDWLKALAMGEEIKETVMPTPDFYRKEERIQLLDKWNVDGSLLFVGQLVGIIGDLDALAQEYGSEGANAVLHAYNEWIRDNFSFNADDRIYAAPMIALWDLDWAVNEARWLAENGARAICMPMGPAHGKAAADPAYDRLWEVLNEKSMLLAFHVSEAPFMHSVVEAFGEKPLQNRRLGQTAWQWMFTYSEIPVMMTIASFIYLNFFERFPNIRMVSAENGSEWLPRFLYKMDKMRGMARSGFWPQGQLKERPSEIFKRHCFVIAYPEDNIKKIIDELGTAAPIVMGSDYPHAEGVPTPAEFAGEGCKGLTPEQLEAVMYGNGRRMIPLLEAQQARSTTN